MIDLKHDFFSRGLNYKNRDTYDYVLNNIEDFFQKHDNELKEVKEIARKIREGVEEISPFIQQSTEAVCPDCKKVCCTSKHGYYNIEDIVYISALGLKPPVYEFGRNDTDPCQFLSDNGCSLKRSLRPSGCNWYFCEPLLDNMEKRQEYQEFDDSLSDIANLWIELTKEFFKVLQSLHYRRV